MYTFHIKCTPGAPDITGVGGGYMGFPCCPNKTGQKLNKICQMDNSSTYMYL